MKTLKKRKSIKEIENMQKPNSIINLTSTSNYSNNTSSLEVNEDTIYEIRNNKIAIDLRATKIDFSILDNLDYSVRPSFIPFIDEKFFKSQKHTIPVVKIDANTYLFPTNASNISSESFINDYWGLCVTNFDLFYITQAYYLEKAKIENDRINCSNNNIKISKIGLTKRRSNLMSNVQFNLAKFIFNDSEEAIWNSHRELQSEIKYKQSDIDFQIIENNAYFKGKETSYGRTNTNDKLYSEFGIIVKLQDGEKINDDDISFLKQVVNIFNTSIIDLTDHFKNFGLLISYSKKKHQHATSFVGLFTQKFKAIGISTIGNINRTYSHEIGHFIDHYLGIKINRFYFSDDKTTNAGKIANIFRENMKVKQDSKYQNRTTECFARAIEQYYCIKNAIEISSDETNYCDNKIFSLNIEPLIEHLLAEM